MGTTRKERASFIGRVNLISRSSYLLNLTLSPTRFFKSPIRFDPLKLQYIDVAVFHALYMMAARPWACWRSARALQLSYVSRRSISDSTLQRQIAAEWQWTDVAAEIRNGTRKSMLSTLEERGFVHQIAG
jgi:hypothetical protein